MDAPFYLQESERPGNRSAVAHYPVANPLDSDVEWDRYYHLDLEDMTRAELQLERARLLMRLAHERDPHPWLRERHNHLQRRLGHG
ncbi:MAG: hypothetical protein ABI960_07545 [Candidatus Eisenbacteria bacterium]